MNPELAYFLKVNAGIALFFAFYRIFLYKDTFFGWRRTVLLCFLGISLLYPLLNIQEWIKEQSPMAAMADLYATVVLPEISTGTPAESTDWASMALFLLGALYWTGVAVLLLRFGMQLVCILRIRFQSRATFIQGTCIFIPKKIHEPFSFFHWIFLCPDAYNAEQLDEILTHEFTHVGQHHSIDVILSELICVACWMNPFAWLLKQEIRNNLEYLADNRVLQNGHNYQSYQYHLLGLAHQHTTVRLSNSFNVLPLKKRIRMMNKKRSREIGKTKYMMFLPLAALLLIMSNIEAVARSTSNLTQAALQAVSGKRIPTTTPGSNTDLSQTKKEQAEIQEEATRTINDSVPPTEKIFDMVEQMPVYPGGIDALVDYVKMNLRYPVEEQKKGIQGRVIVQFIVGRDGTARDATVVRSVSPAFDAEALRIVSGMPKWIPGKQRGETVAVRYTVPISFQLTDNTPNTQTSGEPVATNPANEPEQEEEAFINTDVMPSFPGGQQALLNYLSQTIRYPESARKEKTEGRVIVQFTVDKEGRIRNPKVVRSLSPDLDAEAIRAVNNMPKWSPGTRSGKPVAVKYTIPVIFRPD